MPHSLHPTNNFLEEAIHNVIIGYGGMLKRALRQAQRLYLSFFFFFFFFLNC